MTIGPVKCVHGHHTPLYKAAKIDKACHHINKCCTMPRPLLECHPTCNAPSLGKEFDSICDNLQCIQVGSICSS